MNRQWPLNEMLFVYWTDLQNILLGIFLTSPIVKLSLKCVKPKVKRIFFFLFEYKLNGAFVLIKFTV